MVFALTCVYRVTPNAGQSTLVAVCVSADSPWQSRRVDRAAQSDTMRLCTTLHQHRILGEKAYYDHSFSLFLVMIAAGLNGGSAADNAEALENLDYSAIASC